MITDLTNTNWKFNKELNIPKDVTYTINFNTKWHVYDFYYYHEFPVYADNWTDFWTYLVAMLPSVGYTILVNTIQIVDEKDNFASINCDNIELSKTSPENWMYYYTYGFLSASNLPITTGYANIITPDGYEMDNVTFVDALNMLKGGGSFSEPYYDGFNDEPPRYIHITGGEDATNQEFIMWLTQNATQTFDIDNIKQNGNRYFLKDSEARENITTIINTTLHCNVDEDDTLTFSIGN